MFTSSIVTVSGPTPPGTGVMRPATSLTGPKSTSPDQPRWRAMDAHVDDRRAGLHHVGGDELRLPDGDDQDVGLSRD